MKNNEDSKNSFASHIHTSWLNTEPQVTCVKFASIKTTYVISSENSMFDRLLESSRRDDSNKWSNIGFSQEIDFLETKIRTLSGALLRFSLLV